MHSTARYYELYGVEMRADMLCGGHAWNVCDGDKGIHTKVFLRDQVKEGRGFDLVEDWLYSAAGAGFDNHRYYGHDADIIMSWCKKNKLEARDMASWRFRDLRSFVYCRETDEGKVFTPGVAYGALHSEVEFADRIVLDLRHDKEAGGARCEKCIQRFKKACKAHGKGEECPSKQQRLGEPALAIHVKSGITDSMDYEEKQTYFNSLAARRSKAKAKAKGRFSDMLKPECIRLLQRLGLPSDGTVDELRVRLEGALKPEAEGGSPVQEATEQKQRGAKKGAKRGAGRRGAGKRSQPAQEKASSTKKAATALAAASTSAAPAARQRRKAARRVNYNESEQEDEEDEEWRYNEAEEDSEDEPVVWTCEICTHENSGAAPGSKNFQGCELCNNGHDSSESEA